MASPLRYLGRALASRLLPPRSFSSYSVSSAGIPKPAPASPLLTLSGIPKRHPLAFGMLFSVFKTSFSDLLVQT